MFFKLWLVVNKYNVLYFVCVEGVDEDGFF